MQLSRIGEFSLLLVASLTIMVGAALAPGLTTIAQALGVSSYAPLLITLPALGAILFAPLAGRMIDKLGARPTLLFCLSGYFIFGCGGALLQGPLLVALDRIVLGGFTVGLMASGTAMISDWYQGDKRLSMIARQGMAIELGGSLFLFVGGLLSEMDWRGPFLLYVLGLMCLLLVVAFVPTNQARGNVNQCEASENSSITTLIGYSVFAMALFFSIVVMIPQVLSKLSYNEAQTGYLLSFMSTVAVLAAMVMPKMVKRFNINTTLSVAFFCYGLAHLLLASSTSLRSFVAAGLLAGIGFGFSIPLLNHSAVERSNEQSLGRNLSMFGMAIFIGQFATSIIEVLPLKDELIFIFCAVIATFLAIKLTKLKSL